MGIDRNAAAVVGDSKAVAGIERDLDAAGMTRHCLIHRIVDDLGGEVVERSGVGAADVHAGPAPDRLESFQNLDRGSVVIVGRRGGTGSKKVGHYANGYRSRRKLLPSEVDAISALCAISVSSP